MSWPTRFVHAVALLIGLGLLGLGASACSADDIDELEADDAGRAVADVFVGTDAGGPDTPDAAGPDVGDGSVLPGPDAMVGACSQPQDCARQFGLPMCPDGNVGQWTCPRNMCVLNCSEPECRTDCDCPFDLACQRGQCLPLNRRNFCCTNPDCPPGSACIQENGRPSQCPQGLPDAGVPFDGGPGFDAGPASVVPVGSACMSMADCNGGFCVDPMSGFPGGYCTQDCLSSMCPTGSVCVGFGPQQQLCLDDCQVNADCRAGYQCVRVGTSTATVCYPEPPSSNNPNGDPVGSGCISNNDCEQGLSCLNDPGWPGGYCTKVFCDAVNNPCPTGSQCFNFPGQSLCLADCTVGAAMSCRNSYYCFGPAGGTGGCIPL